MLECIFYANNTYIEIIYVFTDFKFIYSIIYFLLISVQKINMIYIFRSHDFVTQSYQYIIFCNILPIFKYYLSTIHVSC